MFNWIKENTDVIGLLLVTIITLYFNNKTQTKLIKLNSQLLANERFSDELFRIRDMLADLMHFNKSSIQDLADLCDYVIQPDSQQAQINKKTEQYLDSVKSNLEKSYDAEVSILKMLESLHTNALLSDELDVALGSLQFEYQELFGVLRNTRERFIHFDRTNPNVQQFNVLSEDVKSNEAKLTQFGHLLDDLTVIVQNKLTSKIYGKSRSFRALEPPRRVLTEEGVVDFRVRKKI